MTDTEKTLVRIAREKTGKTQQQCAEEFRILKGAKNKSQSTWSRMERDQKIGNRDFLTVWMLSMVLDCKWQDVVPECQRQAIIDRRNKAIKKGQTNGRK